MTLYYKNRRYHTKNCIFRTVIAIIDNITLFEGSCSGVIKETRSGVKGFGYDPIFKQLVLRKPCRNEPK